MECMCKMQKLFCVFRNMRFSRGQQKIRTIPLPPLRSRFRFQWSNAEEQNSNRQLTKRKRKGGVFSLFLRENKCFPV